MGDEATPQANGASLTEVIKLRVSREKLKTVVTGLTSERDTERTQRLRAEQELAEFKAKADTSPLAKQNAELKQKLRTVEHRKAFDALAAERGCTDPKAQDILFRESGWKADADEFDADEMAAAIDNQKESFPFLFKTGDQPVNGQPKPAPGRGQSQPGKKQSTNPDIIEDNDPRMSDAAWQMKNRDKMIASARAKIERGDTNPANYTTVTPDVAGIYRH